MNTVTVCWHAGFGPLRASQTVGSLISHLAPDVQTHFVTGTAAPCTSIFKPVWLGAPLPGAGPEPTDAYNAATLFWQHESLHRATLRNYATLIKLYADERDALERQFMEQALAHRLRPLEERAAYAVACFTKADDAESRWLARVLAAAVKSQQNPLHALAWRGFNRAAGMPEL